MSPEIRPYFSPLDDIFIYFNCIALHFLRISIINQITFDFLHENFIAVINPKSDRKFEISVSQCTHHMTILVSKI